MVKNRNRRRLKEYFVYERKPVFDKIAKNQRILLAFLLLVHNYIKLLFLFYFRLNYKRLFLLLFKFLFFLRLVLEKGMIDSHGNLSMDENWAEDFVTVKWKEILY